MRERRRVDRDGGLAGRSREVLMEVRKMIAELRAELAWINQAIVAVRRVEWKRRARPPKWVRVSLRRVRGLRIRA